MTRRWLSNLLIGLAAIAVLASVPSRGNEAGSTPLSVPVDEKGFDKEVEYESDESSDSELFVCLIFPDGCRPLISCMPSEGIPKINVLQDRCFGTRGPPPIRL